MECPACKWKRTSIKSGVDKNDRRRRACKKCGKTFETRELAAVPAAALENLRNRVEWAIASKVDDRGFAAEVVKALRAIEKAEAVIHGKTSEQGR